MTHAKRKGWIRLYIVLSAVWIVGIVIYAAFDFSSVRWDLSTAVGKSDPSFANSGWVLKGQESFLTTCNVKNQQVSCSPRVLSLLGLALVPVVMSWPIAFLLVRVVLWVRAGFRDDEI